MEDLVDIPLELRVSDINAHPGTFGLFAVKSFEAAYHATQAVQTLREAVTRANESIRPDLVRIIGRYETAVNANLEGTFGQLEFLAENLEKLEPYQEKLFNTYFEEIVPDRFKSKPECGQLPDGSWAKWLARADVNDQLEFWQWHVSNIEKHQLDPEVQATIDQEKQLYKQAVRRGADEGWLHPEALTVLDSRTDEIKTYIGDVFDTVLQERAGYHVMGSDEIIIAEPDTHHRPGTEDPLISEIRRIMKHELNHAVLGDLGNRWLREAATQHIVAVMERGGLDIIDPALRRDDDTIYAAERRLLDVLLNDGSKKIPASLVTLAYSALTPVARQPLLLALETSLNTAWKRYLPHITLGNSVLDVINSNIAEREKALESNNGKDGQVKLTPQQIQAQAVRDVTNSLGNTVTRLRRYNRHLSVLHSAQVIID